MKTFYLEKDIQNILYNSKDILNFFSGKRIIITGGRGFLGKYFVEVFFRFNKLLKNPIKVTVIDNLILNNKMDDQISKYKKFNFLNNDVSLPFNVEGDLDIIIHAAGIASPYYYRAKPIETLDVAVKGTRNALDLAKIKSAKVIFFSSSEIYGDPDPKEIPIKESYRGNVSTLGPRACYDESKRVGETLCYIYHNYYKNNINIIRPFNIYGPGMQQNDYRILPNFASKLISSESVNVYGSGNQTRTYCYITDAINGFLRVIAKGISGHVYNIGNPNPEVSVFELIKILQKVTNKNFEYNKVKYPSSYPSDEPQRRCPDISKAEKDLSYFPKINLETGLKNFLQWAEDNYINNS